MPIWNSFKHLSKLKYLISILLTLPLLCSCQEDDINEIFVESGTWNVVKSVRDAEIYLANLEQCDADYAEFEAKVRELAK